MILRPVSDYYLKHACSTGSSGYMMVNETVADNDSTYIYQTISNTSSEYLDSRFVFGSNGSHAGKFTVNSVTFTVTARTTTKHNKDISHISYWVAGGTQQSDVTKDYTNFSISYSAAELGIANRVYNSFDEGDFEATVQTTGLKSDEKHDDFQIRVTQLYLTIDYNPLSTLYIRQNNVWKQCTPYKKINGVWTQQDSTFLGSSNIAQLYYKGG